jgi:UDP-3-O-[3-hydroxymyristoyl] glucosamine N-acyltransferase
VDTSLSQLASLHGGSISGDGDVRIRGVASLDGAGPDDLAPLLHPRYLAAVACCGAGALLTDRALAARVEGWSGPLWIHPAPRTALALAMDAFAPEPRIEPGVHRSAIVDPSATVDPSARIEALAVVCAEAVVGPRSLVGQRALVADRASVGADCRIGPGAMVLARCVVGDRVRLGPGAVVGSDGFGFIPAGEGRVPRRVPQLGRAVLEDDVELGALATVDRATLGDTVVRRGAKIDNHVQIGHNAEVGAGAILAAQVGLAGSVTVGPGALLGGQAGVADHLVIGRDARVAAKSGVVADVADGATVAGYPAIQHRTWLRIWSSLARRIGPRLPEGRR